MLVSVILLCLRREGELYLNMDTEAAAVLTPTSKLRSKLMRKQFDTNFFGLIDVTDAVLPTMRAQRSGTVVLVGSRSSWRTEVPVSL